MLIRLQKYFTDCGVMSRRAAEAEIAKGSVTVNGTVAETGQKVDPKKDTVLWNGKPVVYDAKKKTVCVLLNKPRGYVTTLSGRRRPLPDMRSLSGQARALAERQAVNTLIQGSAADLIKFAMLAVFNDTELRRLKARLLLQIHDELIVEVPEDSAQAAAERLSALMVDTASWGIDLAVPLVADAGIGQNWGEAH